MTENDEQYFWDKVTQGRMIFSITWRQRNLCWYQASSVVGPQPSIMTETGALEQRRKISSAPLDFMKKSRKFYNRK